jgi:hypothetical protein
MSNDPNQHGQEPEDDITRMMVIIGVLLAASMIIAYVVAL